MPNSYPPDKPDERLLQLSSLNWLGSPCEPLNREDGPEYELVGQYNGGPFGLALLSPRYWSTKYEAYVYSVETFEPSKPFVVRYSRHRFAGLADPCQGLFTNYYAYSDRSIGAKLCLHRIGDVPFPERLGELSEHELERVRDGYPEMKVRRGPGEYDFFDFDFLGEEDEPAAVGRRTRSLNIDEPDLHGQWADPDPHHDEFQGPIIEDTANCPEKPEEDGDDDEELSDNGEDGYDEESVGWTGPWVDKLLSIKEAGGRMPVRKAVKWYTSNGENLWGVEMIFQATDGFKVYEPNTKRPNKCIEGYFVGAQPLRVFVKPKWFEPVAPGPETSSDSISLSAEDADLGVGDNTRESNDTPPASAAKSLSFASMSSSEDEAPETVSRAASRSQAASQRKQKRAFDDAEREKRQAKSKARAQQQNGRDEQDSAVARMERAMREAQEEDSGDSDEGKDEGDEDGRDSMDDVDEDEDDDDEDAKPYDGERIRDMDFSDEDDEDGSGGEDNDSQDGEDGDEASEHDFDSSMEEDPKPSYLPDHLFQTALATVKPPKPPPKELSNAAKKRLKRKERKKARHQDTKDVLLGDRTVRVLPSEAQSARSAARRTLPPASMNKFVRKSLLLKSSDRKRDWERKSADMIMNRARKRPAQNFVRG
ncbi:hypothetical protein AURDEDRAFT_182830 [Auricularia subglabra TFB-10046 SS5]|nr:hypothetical protein AURDEDRAFT_182830 [Auricularia subglabra TFB-10046 SS5]